MTIIEKIKQSIEGATGMPFLYHAAGELNELIARSAELPCAFAFLLDSGTIDDVNGRYHERVTIAVMFCDKTQFDFNALENEEIIDRMKVKAYKWMQSLRMSNALLVVSVNNTQRLYDNTTDILTGFAVNITLEDIAGVGECELPQVVIDVDKNGSYDVVGVDRVRVNVQTILEELEVKQNGEYLPPTDIAGFSKVVVNVLPKTTDLVATENDKEYLPSEYGVEAFGSVKTDVIIKIKPRNLVKFLKQDNIKDTIVARPTTNVRDEYPILNYLDLSECLDMSEAFAFMNWYYLSYKIIGDSCYADFTRLNVKSVTNLNNVFNPAFIPNNLFRNNEIYIDASDWDTSKCKTMNGSLGGEYNNSNNVYYNIIGWDASSLTNLTLQLMSIVSYVGYTSIDDVISQNIKVFNNLKVNANFIMSVSRPIKLNRASLRAIINGLADLTGDTTRTLNIGDELISKLTEEDIAIATAKNWTIA